ncbi:hypothetical protein EON81_12050 [bacterium]|nr:MAG: hypothetical protein EON81_12050 [bacterium]
MTPLALLALSLLSSSGDAYSARRLFAVSDEHFVYQSGSKIVMRSFAGSPPKSWSGQWMMGGVQDGPARAVYMTAPTSSKVTVYSDKGRNTIELNGELISISWDGSWALIQREKSFALRNLKTGAKRSLPASLGSGSTIHLGAVSDNGVVAILGTKTGQIRDWTQSGAVRTVATDKAFTESAMSMAISGRGGYVAVSTGDGNNSIVNLKTGKLIKVRSDSELVGLAEGLVACPEGNKVVVRSADTGESKKEYASDEAPRRLFLSPSGKHLVALYMGHIRVLF